MSSMSSREIKIVDDWVTYYPNLLTPPSFQIADSFYFDERPMTIVGIPLIGRFYLSLPIRTGRHDSYSYKSWGFYFIDDGLSLRFGNRYKHVGLPFIAMEFVGTEHLMKDNSWYAEKKIQFVRHADQYQSQEKFIYENKKSEIFDYEYKLDGGEVQHRKATVAVERRTWYRKWFKWLPKLNIVKTSIAVEFDDEVGSRAGSWKGGCVGTSYTMKPGETPEQTLRRMEAERRFD